MKNVAQKYCNDCKDHEIKLLYNYLDLGSRVTHFNREIDKKLFKNSYQTDFLRKIFPLLYY